jgi:DNA-binding MarR family transcriptional regulator
MARRASALSDPAEQLADALHSAAIHLLRKLRREDTAASLGPARLSALSVVVYAGPLRVSDLARAEQVRTPTMTPIVAALEEAGLVERLADANDARASILKATARGRRLMAEARARRVRVLAKSLRALPESDRRLLETAAGLLRRVAQ